MNRLILLLLTAMGIALLYLMLRSVARLFENGGPSADFDEPYSPDTTEDDRR